MSLPTLAELYEEYNFKLFQRVVVIGGHIMSPMPRELSYSFAMGETPTCTFQLDNPAPAYLVEDAGVEIYLGFNNRLKQVFNGTVESVSPSEGGLHVQASGISRRLSRPFKRTVTTTDGVTSSNDLEIAILTDAHVPSFHVNLPDWTPGTAVMQPLQFQTFGEAVNKIAEPFGSPFYELPSGQIRVELRDFVPAPDYFRHYFSGILRDNGVMQLPANVVNERMQPRIRSCAVDKMLADVKNKVTVRGASLEGIGGDGEETSNVIEEEADAPSPWIPDIEDEPQFVEMTIDNELIDTVLDAAAVAARYVVLYNRLFEQCELTIDGDPEIFLGATVLVTDIKYTGTNSLYFVQSYTCNVGEHDFSTQLSLIGGRASGNSPRISPFASFTWRNLYSAIPPNLDASPNNSSNVTQAAAKLKQFLPDGALDDGSEFGGADPGEAGRSVVITFDARSSVDPDGYIVEYAWVDSLGHHAHGRAVTFLFDPEASGSAEMTLTVTDNDGKTDSQTETFNINTYGPADGYGFDGFDAEGSGNTEISTPIVDETDPALDDPASDGDPDSSPTDETSGTDGNADDGAGSPGGNAKKVLTFIAAQGGGIVQYPNGAYRRIIAPGPEYCVAIISNSPPVSDNFDPNLYSFETVAPDEGLVVFGGAAGIRVFRVAASGSTSSPIWLGQYTGALPTYTAIIGLRLESIDSFLAVNSNGLIMRSTDRGHTWHAIYQATDALDAALKMVNTNALLPNQPSLALRNNSLPPLGLEQAIQQEQQILLEEPDTEDPEAPAPSRLIIFGTEGFELHPEGTSYYIPDITHPEVKETLHHTGFVSVAPSMAVDGAYYIVDDESSIFFGFPPVFNKVLDRVIEELGLTVSGTWEPGTEGTMLLGGENGLVKELIYNATTDPESNPDSEDTTSPVVMAKAGITTPGWPYGFIYQQVTWQITLVTPGANLLSLTPDDED